MAENQQRSIGRPNEYKFDRGGFPTEMGPYVGIVVNNVDNTRQGRLQVWIEQFGASNPDGSPNLTDPTVWKTVRYCAPFYGATKQSGATGVGTYPGNRNSYGMWFTPPDLGTRVLCFFVAGDPSVGGYYVGCLPEDGINHMIPAIGAVKNFQAGNPAQAQYLAEAPGAPVTEINDINPAITNSPRFFDQPKPVQSVVAGILIQQGLENDAIRGPITSSSQRESPSNCYGISTPGKPIYQGGYSERNIRSQLEKGQVKLQDIAVIGRQGGHTFVMDDGDIDGKDTLIRIRTAKGHQITMSDDGDCFYITHANGQTWLEFGKQGTVDVYSSNSINLRTQGVLNFHADKGINMYSGGLIRMKSKGSFIVDSNENVLLHSEKTSIISGKTLVGVRSDGTLALQGASSSIRGGQQLNLQGKVINLNGAATTPVPAAPQIPDVDLPDTSWIEGQGWTSTANALKSIVTRAPTHEPYAGHGRAADVFTNFNPVEVPQLSPDANTTKIYNQVSKLPVVDELTRQTFQSEIPATVTLGTLTTRQVTALTGAAKEAATYVSTDADGNLLPGWKLNANNAAVYAGDLLGVRGVGQYGQSVPALINTGFVKSSALTLINTLKGP
jgi:hypothetical protein